MPIVDLQSSISSDLSRRPSRIVFVVDEKDTDLSVNGYELISFSDFCSDASASKHICIAVGNNNSRRNIYQRVVRQSIDLLSVYAPNSIVHKSAQIGDGAVLSPFTIITANTIIGKCFHANLYSYVAHDCVIGDFVTFAPGVKCNGNVIIEDDVYVGTGAIIKQGSSDKPIIIGRGSIIEAGSYVTRSVQPHTTMFGNPATKMTLSALRKSKSNDPTKFS